ncbi:alpha/beta hydrolase [Dactylosporangium sp. AC04546]|uniref:alpha/beta fold hydrolase n=1 Tax=Dactylosporangium sp. AC04546 TaxID=2862460 RepID=UPI001EDDD53F|nr:alpha/beta hydrolase [Dactylosporangium sp. AC04546]WVK78293.1 alpha/beta hydrolase [Dactylosporangium sp. AC04546]
MDRPTHHRYAVVGGHQLFYREAGPPDAPAVVLLHGFPASSYMFRRLIPALSDRYHVIAPDMLGFGLSDAPDGFGYTFDALTELTAGLLDQLGLRRYAIYVQDYGAPVGWRLALRPERPVTAIVTQNGNGYEAGFNPEFWAPIWAYAADPSPATEAPVRSALELDAVKWQYLEGTPDPSVIAPETWLHDHDLLRRPGNDAIQLALFRDYPSNLRVYPRLHEYLRRERPPVLAVWGRNDRIFDPAGALAFREDVPDAEVHLRDGGHFLLESDFDTVATYTREFLGEILALRR